MFLVACIARKVALSKVRPFQGVSRGGDLMFSKHRDGFGKTLHTNCVFIVRFENPKSCSYVLLLPVFSHFIFNSFKWCHLTFRAITKDNYNEQQRARRQWP
jgi:hypothetical protein